ncbi:MAG TPA: glycosyltransferase family 1 protein, partial [Flavobacteriaceae bacterium]|nr:glycosyltransferase family 1 protein [Flavobacteriaceae bacterium]
VPVVTSNIEPFKSIGRGALFVNPYSVTEIKKAFSKLYDSEFVKNKISEDKENSKRFALKEITTKYDQLYAQL